MNAIAKTVVMSACLAIITSFTAYAGPDYEDTVTKTFDVSPGGTLTVDTDLGAIEITTAKRPQVYIRIERKLDAGGRRAEEILDEIDLDIDKHGNDVVVNLEYDRSQGSFFDLFRTVRNNVKFKFFITVPEDFDVDLRTSGGSIKVDDLDGSVRARTSGGSLKFGNINGPVVGKTSGGSITLTGSNGDADLKTSGGSITIGNVSGDVVAHTSGGSIRIDSARGTVNARTSGGGIKVNEVAGAIDASTSGGGVTARITRQPEHDCRLTTSGGGINVYLAPGINLTVDAKTSGGKVKTDIPITITGELKKSELNADINDGGPELFLRSSGGGIALHEI